MSGLRLPVLFDVFDFQKGSRTRISMSEYGGDRNLSVVYGKIPTVVDALRRRRLYLRPLPRLFSLLVFFVCLLAGWLPLSI